MSGMAVIRRNTGKLLAPAEHVIVHSRVIIIDAAQEGNMVVDFHREQALQFAEKFRRFHGILGMIQAHQKSVGLCFVDDLLDALHGILPGKQVAGILGNRCPPFFAVNHVLGIVADLSHIVGILGKHVQLNGPAGEIVLQFHKAIFHTGDGQKLRVIQIRVIHQKLMICESHNAVTIGLVPILQLYRSQTAVRNRAVGMQISFIKFPVFGQKIMSHRNAPHIISSWLSSRSHYISPKITCK